MNSVLEARNRFLNFPENSRRKVAIDFETTGVHLRHESQPFMCSATYDDGECLLWMAEVDPKTREPRWSDEDVEEIYDVMHDRTVEQVMSNKKFDTRCAAIIFKLYRQRKTNWKKGIKADRTLKFRPCAYLNRCHETLAMHHALNNCESHALKDAAVKYAGIPDSDEKDLTDAVIAARRIALTLGWAIASQTSCPQQKKRPDKGWQVMDYWLPRQVALYMWRTGEAGQQYNLIKAFGKAPTVGELAALRKRPGWEWHPGDVSSEEEDIKSAHPWHTVCSKYCCFDTLRSIRLFKVFRKALLEEGLWEVYLENQINSSMTYRIESRGVTFSHKRAETELARYKQLAENARVACGYSISPLFPLNPNSPDQVRNVIYKHFGCKVTRYTKNKKNKDAPGNPTTDKDFLAELIGLTKPADEGLIRAPTYHADMSESYMTYIGKMQKWHQDLVHSPEGPERGKVNQLYAFCASLLTYKKAKTNISQLEGWILKSQKKDKFGYAILYPTINPYGPKTTRQSMSDPNGQNVSKGGNIKKTIEHLFKNAQTLRTVFGPKRGREWFSNDYVQLQLIIFAIMSGTTSMVEAYINGADLHDWMARLVFGLPQVLPSHPDWELTKPDQNQRRIAKNVNFGFVFGAQEAKLNLTAGMPGLYDILCNKIPTAPEFLSKKEWEVRSRGYVETLEGYRLYVPEETPYAGSVYAIQGTEGVIVKRATYLCQDYINRRIKDRKSLFITLPVHDELNFDSRKRFGAAHIGSLCSLMELGASSLGVPARVECKYVDRDWGHGDTWAFEPEIVEDQEIITRILSA